MEPTNQEQAAQEVTKLSQVMQIDIGKILANRIHGLIHSEDPQVLYVGFSGSSKR